MYESRTRLRHRGGNVDQEVHTSDLAIDDAWESEERSAWAAIESHKEIDSFVETDINNTQHMDSFGRSESTKLERFFGSLLRIH
jgi:hypothetical protein